MKKLRIGHIGTFHDHSDQKLRCVARFPELFEVVGIVEENEERRRAIEHTKPYCDYPFMTEEQLFNAGVDCVMCEGFELDLPFAAKRCIENGIPVHCDKPAGEDLAVFKETLELAKAKNVPFQMAYMYRYNPAVQDCLKLVRDGVLGEILNVTAVMNTAHDANKRAWLGAFRGGDMLFLGCHMVDLIHLMQGTPEKITPYLKSSGLDGNTSMDQTTAILAYRTGFSIAQANSTEIGGWGRRQLVVCGSEGTYEICPIERPMKTKYTHISFHQGYQDRHVERDLPPFNDAVERYDGLMTDFARMVRGEIENPFSYEYEYQTQRMVLAACGFDVDFRSAFVL